MKMNKLTIPAILAATVLVAGMFAFMPVQQASTVHLTLGTAADLATVDANVDLILADTGASLVIGAGDTVVGTGTISATEAGVADADDDADNTVSDTIGSWYLDYTWDDSSKVGWVDGADGIIVDIADAATGTVLCTQTDVPVGGVDEAFAVLCDLASDTFVDYTFTVNDAVEGGAVTVNLLTVTLTKTTQTG